MATETEVKHTPGPWDRIDPSPGKCGIVGILHGSGVRKDFNTQIASVGMASQTHDEIVANTRLIAAAPGLFKVATKLDFYREALLAGEYSPNSPAIRELLDEARAAIAAASPAEKK